VKTLAQLIARNALLFPDDRFLVEGDRTQTNRQHLERARKLASALHRAGCRRQDRVAILAMNCSEYIETFSAAWLAGFILSTVNFRLAPPEIRFVLGDTQPRVLIFEAQYADMIAALRADLPGIETYVAIGPAPTCAPPWAEPYEAFVAQGSADGPPISAAPGDIAHIIYTSGTTGRPKGVMRSHACELALAETMSAVMDMRPRGRLLEVMPFFHAGAQSSMLGQLWRGGEVHIHRRFDAVELLRAVQDQRISHLHLVPLMVEALVETPEFDSFDLSSIETILYAAAPMPAPVLRRALVKLGPVFVNSWGMTEGSGAALPKHMHEPDGPGAALLGSIGQPYANAEIRIVDDHGLDCAVGAPGELWLRSAAMASGYWNDSAATIESFRDGWLRTGDIGHADAAGRIFLVDRRKDMIISGGENIYSQEVERAIAEHQAVAGVAVIGVPDAKWGEAVMAIVIARPGETVTAEDLIRHCAGRIASYKKPRHVVFVDEFQTLPSGKINKMRLREIYGG
jgi:acyl-CoA synthetase (AMP-forming)/AMP-acid ligase II